MEAFWWPWAVEVSLGPWSFGLGCLCVAWSGRCGFSAGPLGACGAFRCVCVVGGPSGLPGGPVGLLFGYGFSLIHFPPLRGGIRQPWLCSPPPGFWSGGFPPLCFWFPPSPRSFCPLVPLLPLSSRHGSCSPRNSAALGFVSQFATSATLLLLIFDKVSGCGLGVGL